MVSKLYGENPTLRIKENQVNGKINDDPRVRSKCSVSKPLAKHCTNWVKSGTF